MSCIRLLSHIATPEACRAHEGLYRNVVAASAALRNIHDILATAERQSVAAGAVPPSQRPGEFPPNPQEKKLPTISPFPVPGGIR